MLFLAWPAQWIAFLPVVLIETALVAAALRAPYSQQLWPVVKANLLSTLVGVPLAWLAMLALEAGVAAFAFGLLPESATNAPWVQVVLFPLMSAWIGGSNLWEFEVAFLVLAVPFCVVSVLVEHRFLRRLVPHSEVGTLRRALWRGNVLTYVLLCLGVVVVLLWSK
jgi:hypothetical protein